MTPKLSAALLAIAVALTAAGCGEKDEPDDPGAPAPPPVAEAPGGDDGEEPAETVDALPPLPRGWTPEINFEGGFEIGLPPGWSADNDGVRSVYSSPDDLIAVTVSADRTPGALALPIDEFALRTSEALGGETQGPQRYEDLVVGQAVPFEHEYDASAVRSKGVPAGSGVPEKALVAVIKRDDHAVYVVIVRENATTSSRFADRDTIKAMIRSLRGRPPS